MNYLLPDDLAKEGDPPVSIQQRDVLIAWATWPPYRVEEWTWIVGLKKQTAQALVRKDLGEGPFFDSIGSYRIELNERGKDFARRWAKARQGKTPSWGREVCR